MTEIRPPAGRLAVGAAAILVMLVAGLAFAVSLKHGFLRNDFATLSQFFTSDGAFELPRRPSLPFPDGFLPFWTHLADSYAWGADALGHHLTNLLIHMITTVLVFAVVRRVLPHGLLAAIFAALFFALSALHWNAVGHVTGRDVPMATMFGLVAVLAALRREPAPILAVLAYAAALLCHPAALAVPLLAWSLSLAAPERLNGARLLRVFVPLVVVGLAYFATVRLLGDRIWRTDATLAVLRSDTLLDSLSRLVLPLNEAITNPSKAPILKWAVFAVLLPLGVLILVARRAAPIGALATGLGWTVIMLMPILSSARLGPDLAESRIFYGVAPGVAFLLAGLFFGDILTPSRTSDPSARRRAVLRAVSMGIIYAAVLGLCLYKNWEAYDGADRLARRVQHAALDAAAARTADTRIIITDPPAEYAGAPVLSHGLTEALARPFCTRREAAQIVVADSHDPAPILAALRAPHPPVTVLWMNHRGRDPDRPFVAVSPEFPRTGGPMPPFHPPRFTGAMLDYWWPDNGLTGTADPGGFRGTVAGEDPWFRSPPMVIPMHWISAVKVRLRVAATVTAPVPVDLFWSHLTAPFAFSAERTVRRVVPPDGTPQELTFRLPEAAVAEGQGRYLARLRLDPPPACTVHIEEISVVPGPACPGHARVAAAWSGLSFGGWVAPPETTLDASGAGLTIRSEGGDPYVVSPAIDLDGRTIRAIEITMRVEAKVNEATVYWAVDKPKGFRETQSRRFKVHAGDGGYHTYTIPFTGRYRLRAGSRLKAIRIDPTAGPGAAWIRAVRVYRGTKLDG